MALCRCKDHVPKGRTKTYVSTANPVGYPGTAVICGSKDCQNPGLIWLTQVEDNSYQNGTRIFKLDSETAKVKADDSGKKKI